MHLCYIERCLAASQHSPSTKITFSFLFPSMSTCVILCVQVQLVFFFLITVKYYCNKNNTERNNNLKELKQTIKKRKKNHKKKIIKTYSSRHSLSSKAICNFISFVNYIRECTTQLPQNITNFFHPIC